MVAWAKVVGCIAFAEWGFIHIAAGVITVLPALKNECGKYFTNIMGAATEAIKTEFMTAKWPAYTNRVLLQHGINLGWIGVWSCGCCYAIIHPTRAMWCLCLAPWLFDVGYFVGFDMADVTLGEFMGELQTFIVSVGLACAAKISADTFKVSATEKTFTLAVPALLFAAGAANMLGKIKDSKEL